MSAPQPEIAVAVLDEEKNMTIDDPAYRAQLPLSSLTRRTSVSPDRATALCEGGRGRAAEFQLSQTRKYVLLTVFCLGVFIDVLGVCVFYILTGPVARDLGMRFEAQTWVITAFATPFASFLLFFGRLSDLYSPTPVFSYGFLAFGLLNLAISFTTEQYSFLILRGVSGVAASCLIPASYRLITAIFDEHELPRAFTVYTLCGSLGAGLGVPLGGIVQLITLDGQMSGWRWYFRITTILIIPMSLWCIKYVPRPRGEESEVGNKIKRLDLPGSLIMFSAILLLILGTTFGASYGFSSRYFLIPFCLSLPLFPLFFWHESRLDPAVALVPPATWQYRNFTLWMALALFTSAWWTCFQIPIIEVFTLVRGDRDIIAAMRILPSGVTSVMSSILLITFPVIASRPRWSYTAGQMGGMLGYGLFIASRGRVGTDYWSTFFPGAAIGSALNNVAATCVIVGAMTAAPPSQAGVVGAILQTAVQAGNAIALTIQAGLLTIHPGGIHEWGNVEAAYWFMFAWGGVCLVAFWVFYRAPVGVQGRRVIAH